ncbi:MAG: tRNA uridine-5-carboxymethylaminomethyl(34) synthesis GTPase MnmE [Candidatus Izemoplasmataceae bacterium]
MTYDTIAAISTALGPSAINIVRMSGDDVFSIMDHVFKGPDLRKAKSHTIHYGKIVDGGKPVDEVLINVFRAPKTFTAEDMIEINCHGGSYVANRILELLLAHGARLAERGEFTERAYLNGRIDLTQAESVLDIIEARSDYSLTLANKGLDGDIHNLVSSLRDELLNIVAQIEVNIDYPEYDDVETLTSEILTPKITALRKKIENILGTARVGKIIREGIRTVIIGRPNVGKSSVLNALLKEDKAIVTEIQGTTRDVVEGEINIGGLVLRLMDTAGIRDSDDLIERIGIDKTKKMIADADLVLYVLNNNEPLKEEDAQLLEMTEKKKRIIIINKIDLENKLNHDFKDGVEISALKNMGIESLEQKIRDLFLEGDLSIENDTFLSNTRHIAKMRQVKQMLDDAQASAEALMPVDIIEIDLKGAWETLGEIIGESAQNELLDVLFSRFCLGK